MTRTLALRVLLPLLALVLAAGIAGAAAAEDADLFSSCPPAAEASRAVDAQALPELEQDLFSGARSFATRRTTWCWSWPWHRSRATS